MLLRKAATGLGCRSCRNVALRATAVRTQLCAPTTPASATPMRWQRSIATTSRLYSTDNKSQTTKKDELLEEEDAEESELASDVPWFLEEEAPQRAPSQHAQKLPDVPEDAPEMIGPMIKYIFEDMGLDDISMFDLRELDPAAALGPNLIMLFGTARSETHLHVSAGRFVRWLRKNHGVSAKADGLIGPGELKTKLRRLRKKAKLMGTNTAVIPRGDNGISTGWICVNFGINESQSNASASFDESGMISGFGSEEDGVTVVVQCMTEARRDELNLETLWESTLRRSVVQQMKFLGEDSGNTQEIDRIMKERIQLPTTGSKQQWQALERASQEQRRFYSTSARRLEPSKQRKPSQSAPPEPTPRVPLDEVRQQLQLLQQSGTQIDRSKLHSLIQAIFSATSEEPNSSLTRLSAMDQLLQSAEEQDTSTWHPETIVTIVEAMTLSPAYDSHIQQARKNIEYLIAQMKLRPDNLQQLRLMHVYASRKEWERFWDVFRIPPRLQQPRTKEHYELAFRAMALTKDATLCTEALRWVYPEMLKEQIELEITGALYMSLKACILTADPMAEQLLVQPPSKEGMSIIQQRQLERREFVRVLREVEDLHRHHIAMTARGERDGRLDRFLDAESSARA